MLTHDGTRRHLKAAADELSVDESLLLAIYGDDLNRLSERLFRLTTVLSCRPDISDFADPEQRARAAAVHLSFVTDHLAWKLQRQASRDELSVAVQRILDDATAPASE